MGSMHISPTLLANSGSTAELINTLRLSANALDPHRRRVSPWSERAVTTVTVTSPCNHSPAPKGNQAFVQSEGLQLQLVVAWSVYT